MYKIIIKWTLIGILLLVIWNIILAFIPYSPMKILLSFLGGMIIGTVCMLSGLADYCNK